MKTLLTFLVVALMSFSATRNVMAATCENHSDLVKNAISSHNSDCKGDRDDDCR